MATLDIVAVLLVLAGAALGALRGAIRILVTFVAAAAGLAIAARYGGSLGAEEWPFVAGSDNAERLGPLVGCLVLYLATLFLGAVAGRFLRRVVVESSMGRADRMAGLLLGAAAGSLFAGVACVAVLAVDVESWREEARASVTAGAARALASAVEPRLPEDTAQWLQRVLNASGPRRRGERRSRRVYRGV